MMRECELQGLQYQQFERASGLAKGSLSNIKGRRSCRFDAFIALCHGLGRKPSEVAALFLDRPQLDAPLTHGRSVPVFSDPSVSRKVLEDVTTETEAVVKKTGVRSTKAGRLDAKVPSAKKNSHR